MLLVFCSCCRGPDFPADGGSDRLMLVRRGWHSDVALAAGDLSPPLGPSLREIFPGARYFVFGFGDKAYFMSRETGFVEMVQAAFPGPAVILVTGLASPPAEAFGAGQVLNLSPTPDGLSGLNRFLADNMAMGPDGRPQRLGDGPYPGSLFYAATASYALFHNCNRWTAEALASAGLPIRPEGVLFAADLADRALAAQAAVSDRSEEKNTWMSGGS